MIPAHAGEAQLLWHVRLNSAYALGKKDGGVPTSTPETPGPSRCWNSCLSLLLYCSQSLLSSWRGGFRSCTQKGQRALIFLKTRLLWVSDSSLCSQRALHTMWHSEHSLGVIGSMARFTVNTAEVRLPKHLLGPLSCHSVAETVQITGSKVPLWVFFSQPEWRSPMQELLGQLHITGVLSTWQERQRFEEEMD